MAWETDREKTRQKDRNLRLKNPTVGHIKDIKEQKNGKRIEAHCQLKSRQDTLRKIMKLVSLARQ